MQTILLCKILCICCCWVLLSSKVAVLFFCLSFSQFYCFLFVYYFLHVLFWCNLLETGMLLLKLELQTFEQCDMQGCTFSPCLSTFCAIACLRGVRPPSPSLEVRSTTGTIAAVITRVSMTTLPLHFCHHPVGHFVFWPPVCPVPMDHKLTKVHKMELPG